MEVLRSPPSTSSYVPLAEHQARTPASFYSGPPVLHYLSERCKVVILERDLLAAPALNALRGEHTSSGTANGNENGLNGSAQAAQNGEGEEEELGKEIVIDGVDVWVTSQKFLLYRTSTNTGIAIPYPSISLHAIQRLHLPSDPSSEQVQGLYMQIAHPSPDAQATTEDEEEESISLTIVPPPAAESTVTTTAETTTLTAAERAMEDITEKPETPTQLLFAAVSACSNLHPDPITAGEEDDEEGALQGSSLYQAGLIAAGSGDGGLPPPADGSSGWITAENMHEYFDEEGNWIGGGEEPNLSLGPGAGTVRAREEDGGAGGEGEEEGEGKDGEETKWRRTD